MTDIDKNSSRLRRAAQTRRRIAQLRVARLAVHRTNGHIYAQIFSAEGDKVVASASTLEKDLRAGIKNGGNKLAAEAVGKRIAEKARAAESSRWRSIGLAISITDGSRPWRTQHVPLGLSSSFGILNEYPDRG